jgi:hypothetical protein
MSAISEESFIDLFTDTCPNPSGVDRPCLILLIARFPMRDQRTVRRVVTSLKPGIPRTEEPIFRRRANRTYRTHPQQLAPQLGRRFAREADFKTDTETGARSENEAPKASG